LCVDTSYRDAVKFLIFEPEALAKKVLEYSPIFRSSVTDEYFLFNRNTVWFRLLKRRCFNDVPQNTREVKKSSFIRVDR